MAEKNKALREVVNRKAAYEFSFVSNYEAGIMLQGTEIKSIRTGGSEVMPIVDLKEMNCTS